MMQGQDVGFRVDASGYDFLRYDSRNDRWDPVTDDPLLRERSLPAGWSPPCARVPRGAAQATQAGGDTGCATAAAGRGAWRRATSCRSRSSSGAKAPRRCGASPAPSTAQIEILRDDERSPRAEAPRGSGVARGFTLIEVLAALVIVALGMLGVIEAVTQSARNGTYLREKTLAHWIAMNVITEQRLQPSRPRSRRPQTNVEFAGQRWRWTMRVTQTQVESMRRMDVAVRQTDTPESPRWQRSPASTAPPSAPAGGGVLDWSGWTLPAARTTMVMAATTARIRQEARQGRWRAPNLRSDPVRSSPTRRLRRSRRLRRTSEYRATSAGAAGFTLMELLVAVAIFAVVGTLALGGYTELQGQSEYAEQRLERTREVQRAVQTISQDLGAARAAADPRTARRSGCRRCSPRLRRNTAASSRAPAGATPRGSSARRCSA